MVTRVTPPPAGTTGPMGPIQVIPPGLTGLLQLKQTGRLPDKLNDVVVPVVEMRDWYLTARRLDTKALFGGVPAHLIAGGVLGNQLVSFNGVNAAVPQGQYWWVEQFTAYVDPGGAEVATDVIRFAPGIVAPNGAAYICGPDVSDYTLAARTRTLRARIDRGFWGFPGDQFCIMVFDNLSTNNWNLTIDVRATPCPA